MTSAITMDYRRTRIALVIVCGGQCNQMDDTEASVLKQEEFVPLCFTPETKIISFTITLKYLLKISNVFKYFSDVLKCVGIFSVKVLILAFFLFLGRRLKLGSRTK